MRQEVIVHVSHADGPRVLEAMLPHGIIVKVRVQTDFRVIETEKTNLLERLLRSPGRHRTCTLRKRRDRFNLPLKVILDQSLRHLCELFASEKLHDQR